MILRNASIFLVVILLAVACGGSAAKKSEPAAETPTTAGGTAATTTTIAAVTSTEPRAEPATSVPATTDAETTTPAPRATVPTSADAEPASPTPTEANGVGDSFYPLLGNGGYDVLRYNITMNVDTDANELSALVHITARATEDLEEFNLDLSGLDVLAVVVANPDASEAVDAEFTRTGTELTVRPGRLLAAGTAFTASVLYTGWPEPLDDPGMPFFEVGWQQQEGVIYTASEPSGSMTWFPSNNHPTDKAAFNIEITVPEGLTAASNGLLVDESTSGGRTTFTWRMDDPMSPYLAAVYIGDFERIDYGPLYEGGPLIRDYVHRDSPPEVAQALTVTPDAIRFIEDVLGPYPFDAYGTIVMPFQLGYALENQTLSLHGAYSISPAIIAHEAAHQWLGNSVALEDWSDIWLNEGFATYLHSMFDAEYYGTDLHASMEQLHAQLPFIASVPPKGIGLEEMFGASVYVRGAMTLHALRLHTGDEVFFDILRAHYERSAHDTTSTAEFLALVDELAGAEAVALVESWLYDETVPALP